MRSTVRYGFQVVGGTARTAAWAGHLRLPLLLPYLGLPTSVSRISAAPTRRRMRSSSSWRQIAITPAGTGGRLGEEPLITAISWRPAVNRLRRQPCGTGRRVPAPRTETVSQREREREWEWEEGGREDDSPTGVAADAPGRHMPAGQRILTASLGTAACRRTRAEPQQGPSSPVCLPQRQ